MKQHSNNQKTNHQNQLDLDKAQSAGPNGTAITPPAYGIDLLDGIPDIQAKLTIGQVGDKYEKEADRVASQVVQGINVSQFTQAQSLQQQQKLDKKIQTKFILQRQEAGSAGEASPRLTSAVNSARGGGQPLDAGLQESMGQMMGADFSEVRVHTDTRSDQLNQSLQALAFTTGQDMFFRKDAYKPESRAGQELIAHELTHVVQQNSDSIQRKEKSTAGPFNINKTSPGSGHYVQRKSNGVASVGPFYDLDGDGIYGSDVPVNAIQVSALIRQIQQKSYDTDTPLNIKVLTGTHGSSNGHLIGEDNFYQQDLSEEGNLVNTGWVNVNNVITAGSKDIVTNWMEHDNRAVILAWCYSSKSYANWDSRHCWRTEGDAAIGWDKIIW